MTTEDIELFKALFDSVGYWSIPVGAVLIGIRLFRSAPVQERIPERFRWSELPMWQRLAIVGAAAFLTSLATALATGEGWKAAAIAAIPVAVSAVFGHKLTKVVGYTMTDVAVARKPTYKPSKFRKASSIVIPLDMKQVRDDAEGE